MAGGVVEGPEPTMAVGDDAISRLGDGPSTDPDAPGGGSHGGRVVAVLAACAAAGLVVVSLLGGPDDDAARSAAATSFPDVAMSTARATPTAATSSAPASGPASSVDPVLLWTTSTQESGVRVRAIDRTNGATFWERWFADDTDALVLAVDQDQPHQIGNWLSEDAGRFQVMSMTSGDVLWELDAVDVPAGFRGFSEVWEQALVLSGTSGCQVRDVTTGRVRSRHLGECRVVDGDLQVVAAPADLGR